MRNLFANRKPSTTHTLCHPLTSGAPTPGPTTVTRSTATRLSTAVTDSTAVTRGIAAIGHADRRKQQGCAVRRREGSTTGSS